MQKIVVIPEEQFQGLLVDAARIGAEQALKAYRQEDRWVNQAEAARLLGVTPNYFSGARLWNYIGFQPLPGGEKRYRVSDVLKYSNEQPAEILVYPEQPIVDEDIDPSFHGIYLGKKRGPGRPSQVSKVIEMNAEI